ncbi:unnamed protein product [Lathyrus sativus]|nr:unnamed protein product [Lathyrus sativus]
MTRKKVKLHYIINKSNRRASYNKRKTGLLKKVKEISTLCGVEACVIIYGENSAKPEVWPPGLGTRNVLRMFHGFSELERNKKMMDLEGFLKKSIEKSQEQLAKQILENKKNRFSIFIDEALSNQKFNTDLVKINEFNDLTAFIDSNIKEVEKRLNSMNLEEEEYYGNGIEAIPEVDQHDNIGNAQELVNKEEMQANINGLDNNKDYDI